MVKEKKFDQSSNNNLANVGEVLKKMQDELWED